MSPHSKLEQLRAKTDRELVALIDRELERGLNLARSVDEHWAAAEKVSTEARQLLPKVYNLGERLRLEHKLRVLHERLDALSMTDKPRLRAAAC